MRRMPDDVIDDDVKKPRRKGSLPDDSRATVS
jgi:hypothetical protein